MSFQTKKISFFLLYWIYLFVCLVLCGIRIYTLYNLVDPATGFFTTSSDFVWASDAVYTALSLLLLLFSCVFGVRFFKKEKHRDSEAPPFAPHVRQTSASRLVFPQNSTACIFISAFCGFSLISFSVLSLIELELDVWEVLLQILAILSGIYLLLQYTPLLPLYSPLRTAASIVTVLWSGLHLVSHFLRSSRIASGEYHNWQMIMLATVAVFFYVQLLFTTPNRALYHFGLYYATGLIGAGLILIFAVPTLLLSSFWYYSAYTQYTTLYALMLLVCVSLYMLVHVFSTLRQLKSVERETDLFDLPKDSDAAFAFRESAEPKAL